MNIHATRSGLSGLDPKAPATTDADAPSRPASAGGTDRPAAERDRVELSDAARSRSSEAQDPALESARTTMRDWPSLDPKRKAMILARMEEGFYSQPDTLKQVAERLYDDLVGRPLAQIS